MTRTSSPTPRAPPTIRRWRSRRTIPPCSNLGLWYATHGQKSVAETYLRRAVVQAGAQAQERQNLALVLGMEGKLAEAETLMREDLPPEVAASNMAYLHTVSAAR